MRADSLFVRAARTGHAEEKESGRLRQRTTESAGGAL